VRGLAHQGGALCLLVIGAFVTATSAHADGYAPDSLGDWVNFSSTNANLSGAMPCKPEEVVKDFADLIGQSGHLVYLRCEMRLPQGDEAMFMADRITYPTNAEAAQKSYERFVEISRQQAEMRVGALTLAPGVVEQRRIVNDYTLQSPALKGTLVLSELNRQCVWFYHGVDRASQIVLTVCCPRPCAPANLNQLPPRQW